MANKKETKIDKPIEEKIEKEEIQDNLSDLESLNGTSASEPLETPEISGEIDAPETLDAPENSIGEPISDPLTEEENAAEPVIEEKAEEIPSDIASETEKEEEKVEEAVNDKALEDEKEEAKEEEKEVASEEASNIMDVKSGGEKKEKKPSKISKWAKEHKAIVIIAAIVLIVALAVTITLVIVNRQNVYISSPEDFIEKSTDGKTTYILKNDITVNGDLEIPAGMSIDTNKNALNISGTLTFSGNGGDKEAFIGDRKGALYLSSGSLSADSIVIDSPLTTLEVYCPVTANCDISLKTFVIHNTYTSLSAGDMDITATEYVTFKGDLTLLGDAATLGVNSETFTVINPITASGTGSVVSVSAVALEIKAPVTASSLNFTSTGTVEVYGSVDAAVNADVTLTASYIIFTSNAPAYSVTSDNASTAEFNAAVRDYVTGGLLLTFRSGATVPLCSDFVELRIYENAFITDIVGSGVVNYYTTLASPADVTINQAGASIMCYIAIVNNADNYEITIDSLDPFTSASNVVDITSYITSAGEHTISVKAISDDPLFIASAAKKINYVYKIQLGKPSVTLDSSDGYKLRFAQIPFATKYKYSVNGGSEVTFNDIVEGEPVEIDITDSVTSAGAYYVKVVAYGENQEAYIPSETTMISFVRTMQLATPSNGEAAIEAVKDGTALTIEWTAVTNADRYEVYAGGNLVLITRGTDYSWTLGDLPDNTVITVIAKGINNGYYLDSAAAATTYEFETLGAPTLSYTLAGGNINLSWTAVENATGYDLYLDGVKVGDTLTVTSHSVSYTIANSGVYSVRAIAEYYREGVSNTVTVAEPELADPVASYDAVTGVLSWAAVSEVTSYTVYLVGDPDTAVATEITALSFNPDTIGTYYVVANASGYNPGQSANVEVATIPAS